MTRQLAARVAWGSVALAGGLFAAITVLLSNNAAVAQWSADEVSSVAARTFQPTHVSLWLAEVGR